MCRPAHGHMQTLSPRLLCHAVLQRHRIFMTGICRFVLLSTMQQRAFPCSWAAVCQPLPATGSRHQGCNRDAATTVVGCDGLKSQTRSIRKGVSTAQMVCPKP